MADPDQAKRPVTRLAGPYGHPLHPMLVPIPIGAWVAALLLDVGSHLVSHPASADGLAEAARWLVGLGLAGALAAATLGLLDLLAIPPGTKAMRIGLAHLTANLTATAIFGASLAVRWGGGGGPVGYGVLTLDAIGVAALTVGGFLGGELAYRYGVRVADEATQAHGYTTGTTATGRRGAVAERR
ncbi:MAG: DUF2231 domain-containing protein [Frankiaceae bacterium]